MQRSHHCELSQAKEEGGAVRSGEAKGDTNSKWGEDGEKPWSSVKTCQCSVITPLIDYGKTGNDIFAVWHCK